MAGTLAEKVWDAHVVRRVEGEPDLLYIDLHLLHEVTSPQAFDGLRLAGRAVRRPDMPLATPAPNDTRPPGPRTPPVNSTQCPARDTPRTGSGLAALPGRIQACLRLRLVDLAVKLAQLCRAKSKDRHFKRCGANPAAGCQTDRHLGRPPVRHAADWVRSLHGRQLVRQKLV